MDPISQAPRAPRVFPSPLPRITVTSLTSREYAVLVATLTHGGEECVLLTRRSDQLARFSGQVAFPGGARDPGDASLVHAALREAHEEVGLAPEHVDVQGELDWFHTGLGHRVQPVIGAIPRSFEATPNPAEVDRVIYLPLSILREDPFEIRSWFRDVNRREQPIYTFQYEGLEIWGLTARILRFHFVERA